MAQDRNSNQLVVQQARAALDQIEFEVAQELGISLLQDGYYGNMVTRPKRGYLGKYPLSKQGFREAVE